MRLYSHNRRNAGAGMQKVRVGEKKVRIQPATHWFSTEKFPCGMTSGLSIIRKLEGAADGVIGSDDRVALDNGRQVKGNRGGRQNPDVREKGNIPRVILIELAMVH
jgi:hypothetical protein